jgi:ferredoxin-NADP reductase
MVRTHVAGGDQGAYSVEHSSNLRKASSSDPRLATARIVRRRDVTDDLFVIWLEPDTEFVFKPGQYITIGAGGIERPYSIVSAPYEPHIELFVEFVLPEFGGHLTPLLHARHVGDVLTMRPKPKGQFMLRAGVRNHVMLATVTGIAPYISMIRQFVHDRETGVRGSDDDSRFFIMQGASHQDEFVYDRELLDLSARYPDWIQVVCSVSRPLAERNSGWAGRVGRIHLLVEEYLDQWALPHDNTLVYLCGNPGMIKDATAALVPRGWAVLAEGYWPLRAQK